MRLGCCVNAGFRRRYRLAEEAALMLAAWDRLDWRHEGIYVVRHKLAVLCWRRWAAVVGSLSDGGAAGWQALHEELEKRVDALLGVEGAFRGDGL
jgi:hypothetical protein